MITESLVAIGQGLLPQDNVLGLVMQIAWWGFFIVYMFYGQRLQIKIMIKEIERSLYKLKIIRDRGREITISRIKEMVKTDNAIADRVDRMLDHVFIPLVNLDPYGVIQKLEHFVDMQEM